MSVLTLFVTAVNIPLKDLNRILVELQDFEFTEETELNDYGVLFSRELPSATPGRHFTPPPIALPAKNEFEAASISALDDFVQASAEHLRSLRMSAVFAVLDQHSIDTDTCLVVEHTYKDLDDDFDGNMAALPDLRCMRLPRDMVWSVMINLDIGKMDFGSFADVDGEKDETGAYALTDYWVEHRKKEREIEGRKKVREKMEKALERLRAGGHVE